MRSRLAVLSFVFLSLIEPVAAAPAPKVQAATAGGPDGNRVIVRIPAPSNIKPSVFTLREPLRLVIDLPKVALSKAAPSLGPSTTVRQVRIGAHSDKSRVVLDLVGTVPPKYEVKSKGGMLEVTVFAGQSEEPAATPAPKATKAPLLPTPEPTTKPAVKAEPTAKAQKATGTKEAGIEKTGTPAAEQREEWVVPPADKPHDAKDESKEPEPTAQPKSTKAAPPAKSPTVPPTVAPTKTPKPSKTAKPVLSPTVISEEPEHEAEKDAGHNEPAAEPAETPHDEHPAPAATSVEAKASPTTAKEERPAPAPSPTAAPGKASFGGASFNSSAPMPNAFVLRDMAFDRVSPGRTPLLKLVLSKPKPQVQILKIDAKTYRVTIANCRLGGQHLALPQFPPSDFEGFSVVSMKQEGSAVEVTIGVEPGTTLGIFVRESEIWTKKL